MKDEKMAREYRKSLKQRLIDEDNFERLEMFDENVEESFLAGLKAGRPQWHKVADGDLPKDDEDMLMSEQLNLLTKMKGTDNLSISIGQYNFSTQEFSYPHFVGLTDVIAWCEIPTFDKE